MSYFKLFLIPSFDINVKEEEKNSKFLKLFEKFGIGSIIEQCIKNDKGKGGKTQCKLL